MSLKFRIKLSRFLVIFGVLWTVAFVLQACSSIDTVFTVVTASLAAIGPALALVGSLLAPGESALIMTAIGNLSNVVVALKAAVDAYLADTTDTTLLSKVEEALAVAQQAIPAFLAAVNIKNPTIVAWITAVVTAVNGVLTAVAADILAPAKSAMASEGKISDTLAKSLAAKSDSIVKTFVGSVDAATTASGLPDAVKAKYHGEFHKHVGTHIGPVHI